MFTWTLCMNHLENKNVRQLQEIRTLKTFKKAIDFKGYISLCSIVESQFFYPRKYTMTLKKYSSLI